MSLNEYPHRVDVYARDLADSGDRMGRSQSEAQTAAGVRCRVNERPAAAGNAFGRETVVHTHRVHFKEDPGLSDFHVLRWTPPGADAPVALRVLASRRPRDRRMPWTVYAEWLEGGTD